MNKKALLSILSGIALFICSCENEEFLTTEQSQNINSTSKMENILKEANNYIGLLNEGNTRNIQTRTVASIEPITRNFLNKETLSRSSNAKDTLLYLINYQNNGGFILMGTGEQAHKVFAVADEGNLHFTDTLYNKGLSIFFKNLQATLQQSQTRSSDIPIDKIPPTDMDYKVVKESSVTPMLAQSVTLWEQGAPYNNNCWTTDGKQAVAGCLPLAIAQIMTCYRHPHAVNDYIIPWRAMIRGNGGKFAANLIAILGQKELLDAEYGVSSTSASKYNIEKTFKQMGYKSLYVNGIGFIAESNWRAYLAGDFKYFGEYNETNSPLLASGFTDTPKGREGHAWVIDGFIKNAIYLKDKGEPDSAYYLWEYDNTLYHCVWGWGGLCNGYYFLDMNSPKFDTSKGPDYTTGIETSSTEPYCFDYQLDIFAGFIPETHDVTIN